MGSPGGAAPGSPTRVSHGGVEALLPVLLFLFPRAIHRERMVEERPFTGWSNGVEQAFMPAVKTCKIDRL